MPGLTLYFLQASRSIRTAWQLEELNLSYDVKVSERENGLAPQHFKKSSGDSLGKFPLLVDGDLSIGESGAIAEYLCEKYDKEHRLLPTEPTAHVAALRWLHAAEATYALHGLAILYARWHGKGHEEAVQQIEKGMSGNVQKDLDFLEQSLQKSGTKFLVGDTVTVADCMMHFSITFILARELGTKGGNWPKIKEWLSRCEATESYKRAVEKTGHKM